LCITGYERELFSNVPQLQYIDGRDRLGNSQEHVDASVTGKPNTNHTTQGTQTYTCPIALTNGFGCRTMRNFEI